MFALGSDLQILKCKRKALVYGLLAGKLEGKGQLGKPRCRCVDNIKMDLVEIVWGAVEWIGLAQDRENGELL
jgi:hypothetical protein